MATVHPGWLVLTWAGFSRLFLRVLSASKLVLPENISTCSHSSCQKSYNSILSQPELPEPDLQIGQIIWNQPKREAVATTSLAVFKAGLDGA